MATQLTYEGKWSKRQLLELTIWARKNLDPYFFGKRLHRGYHVFAPKYLVPAMQGKNKMVAAYLGWGFENLTNYLRKKQYDKRSLPSTYFWVGFLTLIGFFVTKEYADNTWKSLYK
jgi:hypothetical protein